MEGSPNHRKAPRSVARVLARIHRIDRHGDQWLALGVPNGLPRLRCTWAISEPEAELLQQLVGTVGPVQRDLGEPVRTVGVPERFPPTDGY